jgi:FAD synthetase
MVRVMATGVFDILHPGHLHYLSEARKLGDELVVVVARDSTARRLKREPVVPEESRRQMVEGLKPVDRAVLGTTGDMYETVVSVKPDVIALGFDQKWDPEVIRSECAKRGVHVKVVRLSGVPERLHSTNQIVERIMVMRGRAKAAKEMAARANPDASSKPVSET